MCASFMIKQNAGRDLSFVNEMKTDISDYYERTILPYAQAPVVIAETGNVVMVAMGFSLIPTWIKEAKPKFATHNARIETVLQKPTWREGFKHRHCLVPISEFYEPIYEGAHAGFMVAFFAQHNSLMWAAGIWEQDTFAILTSEPPPFISGIGHDRCPIFLNQESGLEWLQSESKTGEQWLHFLDEHHASLDFSVRNQRAMRPGWEKRK